MRFNPDVHHRRSIRLQGYDYAQAGAYFVTICTQDRECSFGNIVDGKMRLNNLGEVVAESWQWLAIRYRHVELDEWIVMPNHFHGILVIVNECRSGSRTAPTTDVGKRKPLGRLIGAFKTVSTKRINELRCTPAIPVWQRDFHEHIIRDEDELSRIRAYIINNPLQWEMDRENPAARIVKGPTEAWQV